MSRVSPIGLQPSNAQDARPVSQYAGFSGGAYKKMPSWARDHMSYMGLGDRWYVKRRLSPTRVVYGLPEGWEALADPNNNRVLNVVKPTFGAKSITSVGGNLFAKDPQQPVATGAMLVFAGVGLAFGLGGYTMGRRR